MSGRIQVITLTGQAVYAEITASTTVKDVMLLVADSLGLRDVSALFTLCHSTRGSNLSDAATEAVPLAWDENVAGFAQEAFVLKRRLFFGPRNEQALVENAVMQQLTAAQVLEDACHGLYLDMPDAAVLHECLVNGAAASVLEAADSWATGAAFLCKATMQHGGASAPVILGLNERGLHLADVNTRRLLQTFPLASIKQLHAAPGDVLVATCQDASGGTQIIAVNAAGSKGIAQAFDTLRLALEQGALVQGTAAGGVAAGGAPAGSTGAVPGSAADIAAMRQHWPPALQDYYDRADGSCASEAHRQLMVGEVLRAVREASEDGTLWTIDWANEPLPDIWGKLAQLANQEMVSAVKGEPQRQDHHALAASSPAAGAHDQAPNGTGPSLGSASGKAAPGAAPIEPPAQQVSSAALLGAAGGAADRGALPSDLTSLGQPKDLSSLLASINAVTQGLNLVHIAPPKHPVQRRPSLNSGAAGIGTSQMLGPSAGGLVDSALLQQIVNVSSTLSSMQFEGAVHPLRRPTVEQAEVLALLQQQPRLSDMDGASQLALMQQLQGLGLTAGGLPARGSVSSVPAPVAEPSPLSSVGQLDGDQRAPTQPSQPVVQVTMHVEGEGVRLEVRVAEPAGASQGLPAEASAPLVGGQPIAPSLAVAHAGLPVAALTLAGGDGGSALGARPPPTVSGQPLQAGGSAAPASAEGSNAPAAGAAGAPASADSTASASAGMMPVAPPMASAAPAMHPTSDTALAALSAALSPHGGALAALAAEMGGDTQAVQALLQALQRMGPQGFATAVGAQGGPAGLGAVVASATAAPGASAPASAAASAAASPARGGGGQRLSVGPSLSGRASPARDLAGSRPGSAGFPPPGVPATSLAVPQQQQPPLTMHSAAAQVLQQQQVQQQQQQAIQRQLNQQLARQRAGQVNGAAYGVGPGMQYGGVQYGAQPMMGGARPGRMTGVRSGRVEQVQQVTPMQMGMVRSMPPPGGMVGLQQPLTSLGSNGLPGGLQGQQQVVVMPDGRQVLLMNPQIPQQQQQQQQQQHPLGMPMQHQHPQHAPQQRYVMGAGGGLVPVQMPGQGQGLQHMGMRPAGGLAVGGMGGLGAASPQVGGMMQVPGLMDPNAQMRMSMAAPIGTMQLQPGQVQLGAQPSMALGGMQGMQQMGMQQMGMQQVGMQQVGMGGAAGAGLGLRPQLQQVGGMGMRPAGVMGAPAVGMGSPYGLTGLDQQMGGRAPLVGQHMGLGGGMQPQGLLPSDLATPSGLASLATQAGLGARGPNGGGVSVGTLDPVVAPLPRQASGIGIGGGGGLALGSSMGLGDGPPGLAASWNGGMLGAPQQGAAHVGAMVDPATLGLGNLGLSYSAAMSVDAPLSAFGAPHPGFSMGLSGAGMGSMAMSSGMPPPGLSFDLSLNGMLGNADGSVSGGLHKPNALEQAPSGSAFF